MLARGRVECDESPFGKDLCNVPVVVELGDGRIFWAEGATNVNHDPYDAKNNTQPLELICESIVELLPVAAQGDGSGGTVMTIAHGKG